MDLIWFDESNSASWVRKPHEKNTRLKRMSKSVDMSSSRSVQAAEKIREPLPVSPPPCKVIDDWWKELSFYTHPTIKSLSQEQDLNSGDFTVKVDFGIDFIRTKPAPRELKIISVEDLERIKIDLRKIDGFTESWRIPKEYIHPRFQGIWGESPISVWRANNDGT